MQVLIIEDDRDAVPPGGLAQRPQWLGIGQDGDSLERGARAWGQKALRQYQEARAGSSGSREAVRSQGHGSTGVSGRRRPASHGHAQGHGRVMPDMPHANASGRPRRLDRLS